MTSPTAEARTQERDIRTTGKVGARAPLPVRERRPAYVALAVLLILGLAVVSAYLYSQAGKKVPVVQVVRHIPAGHAIERSDLSTVEVAGAVTAISGSRMQSVLGKTAAVELLPNTLLQRSMVTDHQSLRADQAQVGVVAKPGQIPAAGLAAGDVVEVLQLPDKNATDLSVSSPAVVLVEKAVVFGSSADASRSGDTLLTLVVPRGQVASVATASSSGLVALVRVGS